MNESLYTEIFEAAADAILVVDENGTILLANAATETTFGWPPAELVGKSIEVVVPERFHRTHVVDRQRYAAAPHRRPMGSGRELNARRRDGTELPVEISLTPSRSSAGLRVCCVVRDISERKRAHDENTRVSLYLENAVESIAGGFAVFDASERLVLCNSSYRQLLARGVEGPVVGRSYAFLLDAAIAAGVFDEARVANDHLRERCVEHHRHPDGPLELVTAEGRHLRLIDRPTPDGGTVSEVWDLTDDAQREAELRRMQVLADAASTAKSEFLSSMSHELRTPLNAVLGFSQLLRRDRVHPLDERQRGMVDHVVRAGSHLLRLVDDVLDLSRIEAGTVGLSKEAVQVRPLLAEVEAALAPMAAAASVSVCVAPSSAELEVTADRTRLRQILINFGSNAIKYGRAGGRVVLAAAATDDAMVRVSVTDDGIGIAAEQHARIFQPFHRAGQESGPIEGTGVGLAISKRLAELMAGSVGFTSELGQGSTFWVDLVRAEAHVTAPVSAQPGADPSRLGDGSRQLYVLYVEDNPSNIALMRHVLGELAHVSLHTAFSAELGIELAAQRRPDVVIMDINLPGMSGLEAVRRLRERAETADIPVIGLSAAVMPRDRKRAAEAGFFRYLAKPVDIDELTAALEAALVRVRAHPA